MTDSADPTDADDPDFDVDAVDDDGDGTHESTVISSAAGIDLDGDGQNDAALLTSETMTDLDGDGLPDVIETTTTMIHDQGDGDYQIVQTTERVFIEHGDLDGEPVLVLDDDADLPTLDDDHPVFRSVPIIRGLQHVAINVADIGAADHFYVDQLGLRRIDRPDIGIPGSWLEAENGLQVHLLEIPDSAGPDSNHLAFTVDDIDASIAALRAKGLDVSNWSQITKGTGKQVFLHDPSGNIVELNQPTP